MFLREKFGFKKRSKINTFEFELLRNSITFADP